MSDNTRMTQDERRQFGELIGYTSVSLRNAEPGSSLEMQILKDSFEPFIERILAAHVKATPLTEAKNGDEA